MLHELTPEQAEKLARLWQWQRGHLPCGYWRRVPAVYESTISVSGSTECKGELMPDLSDNVTRDGLLRTCRKAWMDDAFAMRSQSGKWKVYVRSGFKEHVFEGATEEAALLAAILAAPEAT